MKSLSQKKFQKLVGWLRYSAISIPASKGIFQLITTALQKTPSTINISPASHLELILEDYLMLWSDIYQQRMSV